jgi:predicted enzyme related to lactoylglutathione lyase
MKVTGIGGVMFRAKNPEALTAWYKEHLGIDGFKWEQQAGPTAFAPSSAETDYWDKSRSFMLNFRVEDLDGLLKQLKANKVKVVKEIESYEGMGRFARIEDLESNEIELWEPEA